MTRARAKKAMEALNQMVTTIWAARPKQEGRESKLVNYLSPHEGGLGA